MKDLQSFWQAALMPPLWPNTSTTTCTFSASFGYEAGFAATGVGVGVDLSSRRGILLRLERCGQGREGRHKCQNPYSSHKTPTHEFSPHIAGDKVFLLDQHACWITVPLQTWKGGVECTSRSYVVHITSSVNSLPRHRQEKCSNFVKFLFFVSCAMSLDYALPSNERHLERLRGRQGAVADRHVHQHRAQVPAGVGHGQRVCRGIDAGGDVRCLHQGRGLCYHL